MIRLGMRALPLLAAVLFLGFLFLLTGGCEDPAADPAGAVSSAGGAKSVGAARRGIAAGDSGATASAKNQRGGADANAPAGNSLLRQREARIAELVRNSERLEALQVPMPAVEPGDWRSFWKEPQQTPQQYAGNFPVTVTPERRALYLCRVGAFSERQEELFSLARQYLGLCYQCEVKLMPDVSLERFPVSARRRGDKRQTQVNSVYLTDSILKGALPGDGWGVMAVSALDIFSGSGLSEQYGDTLLFGRAGVISLYNLTSPNPQVELERVLKGTSHETGHLLSMPHCARSLCNMNGRAGLKEFDRAPLTYCPDCLAKLLYATGADPDRRFAGLEQFCRAHEIREVEYYIRARQLWSEAR